MDAVYPTQQQPGESDPRSAPRIVALLTCFNRRSLTLACLEALAVSAARAGAQLRAILVDDASPDGTAVAVRERFAWVDVIEGPGNLFWNRGMHRAFGLALRQEATHYLWINDDTHLVPDALSRLLAQSEALLKAHGKPAIVIGATADRSTGQITYGGRVSTSRWRPFRYELVWNDHDAVACRAMEGNCVLIPRAVAERVGNLDPTFEHAMGDTDYGLRALAAGFGLFVAPGVAGHCSINPTGGTYFDKSLPLSRRWQLIRSRKGLPVRSWLHFTRRHGGPLWPVHFAWPYAKVLVSGLRGAVLRRPDPAGSAT